MSKLKNKTLSSIETAIETNGNLLSEDAYENFEGLQKRIDSILLYAKTRLSACPSALLIPAHVNQINKIIGNINTSITNYISDKDITHLHSEVRDTHLPSLISNIQTRIPIIASEVDISALTQATNRAIQDIRSKNANLVQAFRSEQAGLDRQFTELKSKKESLESSLAVFQSEWDAELEGQKDNLSELIAELEAELKSLKEELAEEEKRIVALNGTFGEKFQLAEKERATEALSTLNSFKTHMKEALDEFKTEKNNVIKNLHDELKKYNDIEAPSIIAALEAQKEEAKKLLGMIGGSTMADGYSKTADKEQKLANKFRTFAGWLWIIAAIATGWLIHSLGSDPTVGKVVARVASVIIMAAPATYMTIESRGHRLEERRNRRYAVEMLALDPYLSPLDDETKKKTIEALVSNYFGNFDKQQEEKDKMPLEQVLEIFKEASKAACASTMELMKKTGKPERP
jgi:predicted  nucleic acid-binding Zn-ribbon protein